MSRFDAPLHYSLPPSALGLGRISNKFPKGDLRLCKRVRCAFAAEEIVREVEMPSSVLERARLSIAVTLALISLASSSYADFVPATIGDDPDAMSHQIRVPDDTPDGTYLVRCEAEISAAGRPVLFGCYAATDKASDSLVVAIQNAGERAHFVPAIDDRKPVAVYMSISAWIKIANGKAPIGVCPNDGANVTKFGLDYIAPQRLNQFTFHERSRLVSPKRGWLWMHLFIDETGKITDSRIDDQTGSGKQIAQDVQHSIELMEFRPGYYQGRPTAMEYVEGACNNCSTPVKSTVGFW